MDGHRRYAEDPDPAWYSRPAPYESGVPDRRPDDEPRYPLTGGVESLAPADPYPPGDRYDGAGYAAPYQPVGGHAADPLTATGGFTRDALIDGPPAEPAARPALDAIRVPLRPTEYPAVRPGGSGSTGDSPTTSTGGHGVTAGRDALAAGTPPGQPYPAVPSPAAPGPGASSFAAPSSGAPSSGAPGFATPSFAASKFAAPSSGAPGSAAPSPAAASPVAPSPVAPSPVAPSSAVPTSPAYNEPTSFVPPVGVRTADGPAAEHAGSGRSAGDGIYRTRRPVSAVLLAVLTAALMIPVIRLLIDAALADRPTAAGIVPAVLLTLGLPLTGVGLYAVAAAGRTIDRGAWLRPPAGYLLVGLALVAAAALATR